MGKKTISIDAKIHRRLRSLKREGESFSKVLDRLTSHLDSESSREVVPSYVKSEISPEEEEKSREKAVLDRESLWEALDMAELVSYEREEREIENPVCEGGRAGEYLEYKIYPCYHIALKIPKGTIRGDAKAIGDAFREMICEFLSYPSGDLGRGDTDYLPCKSTPYVFQILEKIEWGSTLDRTNPLGYCSYDKRTRQLKVELFCEEDPAIYDDNIDYHLDDDL